MADSLDPPLEPLRRTTSENLQAASERLLLPVRIPKRRTSSRKNSLVRRSPRESNSPINIPNRLLDTNDGILSPRRQIMCVGNYDLGRTIGSGQFGKVKIATHVITGETVAVKIIRKQKLNEVSLALIKSEIEILKFVKHPNIIKLYEVLETDKMVFLVQELASGGEALDFVVSNGKLTEERARKLFRQIISAISYCHERFISHRDLKAENLLLDEDLNIKVIDFGFAAKFKPDEYFTVSCGSPMYAAPELLTNEVKCKGPQVDIWSLGVLLYVFVTGKLPFKGDNFEELFTIISKANPNFPEHVSEGCKDLITKILQVNPDNRATMKEILEHPWVVHTDNWVKVEPDMSEEKYDDSLFTEMGIYGFDKETVLTSLRNNSFDSISATFRLLQLSKKKPNNIRRGSVTPRARNSLDVRKLSGFVSLPTSPQNISPRTSRNASTKTSPETKTSDTPDIDEVFSPLPARRIPVTRAVPNTPVTRTGSNPTRSAVETDNFNLRKTIAVLSSSPRHPVPVIEITETDKAKLLRKVSSEKFNRQEIDTSETEVESPKKIEPSAYIPRGKRKSEVQFSKEQIKLLNERVKNVPIFFNKDKTMEEPKKPRARRTAFSVTSTKDPHEIVTQITDYFEQTKMRFEPIGTFCFKALDEKRNLRVEIEVCEVPNLKNIYSIRIQRVEGDWMEYKKFCHTLLPKLQL